ncbi:MAG: glycosyltransferase family 4 protein [Lachnospiraceae bacterium]|nr:glycosyltransferase family 4 protein [Lachnospiraceae bacterium]
MTKDHKQNVLIVHNYYQIPGGEDTVVSNEKKMLEENGHKVFLYTRNNKEINEYNVFQKIKLPFASIFSLKTYFEIKKIIKEQDIEIVHVHNTLSLISPSVFYACNRLHVPVVQTMHNFRLLCPNATFFYKGKICEDCLHGCKLISVKRKCYRNSATQTLCCVINNFVHGVTGIYKKIYFICLTEFNKNKLLNYKGIHEDRIFIKPNFTSKPDVEVKEVKENFYLFVGRMEEIKGVRLLVKAFSLMPDKNVKVIGDGPLFEELKEECLNHENIQLLGRKNHDEVMHEMARAKALIITSQIYEGFPVIIPEAFSVKTPIIAGDVGNTTSLVQDGINGLKFKYDSAESLAETVTRFENINVSSIETINYNSYLENYTKEKNYMLLKAIYDRMADI